MPAGARLKVSNPSLVAAEIDLATGDALRGYDGLETTGPLIPAIPSKTRMREARRLANTGVRLAQHGQHERAIARLKRSAALDPTVAGAWHNLGLSCLQIGRLEEAAGAFEHASRLDPNSADAHNQLAVALDHLGRKGLALRAYEAAVKLEPLRPEAQFRLGQLYFALGRRGQAEAAFRTAAEAAAGSPHAQICEAFAADAAGDGETALNLLRAAIIADPENGIGHLTLGAMLARAGQFAEAAFHLERGITLQPDMVASWLGFANVVKFTSADRAIIERMDAGLSQPHLAPAQRKALHFALGKAHDDLGNYAEAMHHYDAGNKIRSAAARLDRVTLERQIDRLIAETSAGFLDRRPDFGVNDETPILIVGLPRSGTTLVEQILSSHPDVAAGGELSFWGDRNAAGLWIFDAAASKAAVRRLADEYLAVLCAISPSARRVTDKMPFNFWLLGIIRQVFRRATFVHCRRHPVDTCLSIFFTDFDGVTDFAGDRSDLVFFYRQYERLMAHWRQVLPPDRFIEIDYEVLVAEPELQTRRLLAACELEWNDACLVPHRNQRPIATASMWQARQPIYRSSVGRWRGYEPWLGELRELLPGVVDGASAGAAEISGFPCRASGGRMQFPLRRPG
jgi:tetratricopeptide (TPR) repeat protein